MAENLPLIERGGQRTKDGRKQGSVVEKMIGNNRGHLNYILFIYSCTNWLEMGNEGSNALYRDVIMAGGAIRSERRLTSPILAVFRETFKTRRFELLDRSRLGTRQHLLNGRWSFSSLGGCVGPGFDPIRCHTGAVSSSWCHVTVPTTTGPGLALR